MPTTIQEQNLRQSIADIFRDAVTYFKLCAEDAVGTHDKLIAITAVKDFSNGRDMLDLLIDLDGEDFLTPRAADTVTQSLLNFHAALDTKQSPLMSWRLMDAIFQVQKAPCLSESGHELDPEQVLH